jgi:hypothetical protein
VFMSTARASVENRWRQPCSGDVFVIRAAFADPRCSRSAAFWYCGLALLSPGDRPGGRTVANRRAILRNPKLLFQQMVVQRVTGSLWRKADQELFGDPAARTAADGYDGFIA